MLRFDLEGIPGSRWLLVVLTAGVLGLGLVACGSDDDGADGGDDGATTAAETTAEGEGDDLLAQIQDEIAALRERPTSIGITEKLKGEAPQGKKVIFMRCPVPICVEFGDLFKEATEAVGWTTEFVNTGGTPSEIKTAYQQAVSKNPDAIVGTGNPRSLMEEEIQQMKEKGIPFVVQATDDEAGDGIVASIYGGPVYKELGSAVADFVFADSDGTAKALFVSTPQYATTVRESDGFIERLEEICDECSAEGLEVSSDTIGKNLPTNVVSHIQANPDIDYVIGAFSDMMLGVPDALAAAGLKDKVKVVVQGISPATGPLVQDGQIAAAYPAPNPEMMWRMVDALMRVFNDESVDPSMDSPYPHMWVDSENLPSVETFPLVEDYQEQYLDLWGLNN